MSDTYADAVDAAVAGIQTRSGAEIDEAISSLEGLDPRLLIAELFLQIEELAERGDVAGLVGDTTLPVPREPLQVVDAVRERDLARVQQLVSTDYAEVLAALLSLLAALDEAARQRRKRR